MQIQATVRVMSMQVVLSLRFFHPEWSLGERSHFVRNAPIASLWTPEQRLAEERRLIEPATDTKWDEVVTRFRGPVENVCKAAQIGA